MERSSKPKVEVASEPVVPESVVPQKVETIQDPAAAPVDPPERQKIRFKKIGGGAFIMKNKMIKPGQIFEAFPEEIPVAFKNTVLPISGTVDWDKKEEPSQVKVKPQEVVKPIYKVVPHGKSSLWFDIVTEIGKDDKGEPIYKILNEKGMKKEVAESLVKDMQK